MSEIVVLDDNMINMIAAGEVIERPASVVKELLENSIDAGAKKIVVRIEDGGRKLISVVDDGAGMGAGDLEKAFLPHATSKIKTSADLDAICTMGFRGEALASIAAVSQVSVTTRIADSIQANNIELDCGQRQPVKPCSGDYGSTFDVRNIFYKMPARRKFLRTANTEMTHIIEHFTRIALAHSYLDMTLYHNDRQLYRLVGNQALTDRIGQLLGNPLASDLLKAESRESQMKIFALLGKPSSVRSTAKLQYVFLNNRYIRDRYIGHAIKEAYRGLIEPSKYPVAFLFLEMPYDAYDVNVHPTKIEVRFENSNLVHSQVLAVLREKLLSANLDTNAKLPTPAINLQGDEQDGTETDRQQRIRQAMVDFFKDNKPLQSTQQNFGFSHSTATRTQQAQNIRGNNARGDIDTSPLPGQTSVESRRFLQLHNSYIVTQNDDGFIIIDQHALHERIIYEDLCRKISAGKLTSQRLLIPETFELTDAQAEAVKDNWELIEKLGIELEPFGPKTMAIQAFPAILSNVCPVDFITDLLDTVTDKTLNLDTERLLHELIDMAACKAAIKAGQRLTETEMAQLLADKGTVERASSCPHGRPTTIKFTISELEKQFKRT